MSKRRLSLMIGSMLIVLTATADAGASDHFAFRGFSKAQFIGIGNRVCGPHGNPRLCCAINDGVWHLLPRPAHCILM